MSARVGGGAGTRRESALLRFCWLGKPICVSGPVPLLAVATIVVMVAELPGLAD